MNQFLTNQKAVVTGGARGIGFAIAKSLLESGADVAICSRTEKTLHNAIDGLKAATNGRKVAGYVADVSNSDSVHEFFTFVDHELGKIDLLVNNAGSGIFRAAADLSIDEWNQIIGTNLSGAFYCSREALTRFRNSGGGWIINISSLAGKNPFAGGAAYNASKFGLNGFSEAMMMDHRHEDVKVSYIMPGSVETAFRSSSSSSTADWKVAPEDVAEIVLDILRKPNRTLVSRVEVRPSKPPQSK